jgi:hypothetical protein
VVMARNDIAIMTSSGGCGVQRPVATCLHAWLGLRSRSEVIGALSVSAGWRDVVMARNDVAIMTSSGGWRVPASSRHLLTRVARIEDYVVEGDIF